MDSRFDTASMEFKGQAIGLMSKEEFARSSALADESSIEQQERAKVWLVVLFVRYARICVCVVLVGQAGPACWNMVERRCFVAS
jgi:hypothetical protein